MLLQTLSPAKPHPISACISVLRLVFKELTLVGQTMINASKMQLNTENSNRFRMWQRGFTNIFCQDYKLSPFPSRDVALFGWAISAREIPTVEEKTTTANIRYPFC